MQKTTLDLIFGSLLHDIGKLVRRQNPGTADHSALGAEWLEAETPFGDSVISDCVRCHHSAALKSASLPDDHPAYLVWMANQMAVTAEQRHSRYQGEEQPELCLTPMRPVFNILNQNDGQAYYPPAVFDSNGSALFPQKEKQDFAPKQYQDMLAHLKHVLMQLPEGETGINVLLTALEAQLSYVPAHIDPEGLMDISLFDHAKLTAAMAVCLKDVLDEQGTPYKAVFDDPETYWDAKAFLIASLDVSGIQKFIYTITSKNALRSLRSRSFYLEILMEHVVDTLLEKTGMSRTNILYTGGGHCYLIFPNTESVRTTFDAAVHEVNLWFLDHFQISLYIAGGYAECSANDLQNEPDGSYTQIFKSISRHMSYQKSHRYTAEEIIRLNNETPDNYERECASCKSVAHIRVDRDGDALCPICAGFKKMSGHILGDNYFLVFRGEKEGALPLPDGCCMISAKAEERREKIQDPDFVREYIKNMEPSELDGTTRIWVGDYTSEKSFEDLANRSQGIARLGVIRADVDNLGQTFVGGFKNPKNHDQYVSIVRTAAFSRHMNLFFKNQINDILKHPEWHAEDRESGRNASIVYSGGDDVFFVGAWDDCIGGAVDLRNRFIDYTEGTLSISAGVGIYPHTYPISVIADEVESQVDASKDLDGKDGITLLEDGVTHKEKDADGNLKDFSDGTYHWDIFENVVMAEKYAAVDRFFQYFQTDDTGDSKQNPAEQHSLDQRGNSFLYGVLNLIRHQDEKINFARLVYMLSRLEPGQNQPKAMKDAYNDFSEKVIQWAQDETDRRELKTAITLYVYLHRPKTEEE